MATTYLNTTTLSAAVSASQRAIAVASNANHNVGEYVVVGGEAMLVQSKASTTIINVERGQLGTSARAHQNGVVVYGSTTTLGPTQYDPFAGEQRVTRADVPAADLPTYPVNLGQRKRDGLGNEYILCDFNSTVYPGQPVLINSAGAFVADALATTGRGPIGVVAEQSASTSDQWGWVQVYGRCFVQLGMSGVSPSDAANGPTTLSTSVHSVFVLGSSLSSPNGVGWVSGSAAANTSTLSYVIQGMTVAVDASPGDVSAVTSGTNGGHTGNQIAVFLNYPTIVPNDITT